MISNARNDRREKQARAFEIIHDRYQEMAAERRILALLGRKEDALGTLRELIDAGFRDPVLTDLWSLELDPFLAVLRDDQRFADMLNEVNRSLAEMYDRVLKAETTGDWETLRAKAGII